MKNILSILAAAAIFCSCTHIAGSSDSNTDSSQAKAPDSTTIIRDETITEANAYSDLFLDSNAVESFIQKEKIDDTDATTLRNFYKARNYEFAWFATDGPTEQARGLWSLYASEGDSAKKEPGEKLKERMDTILQKDSLSIVKNDSSFVQTELTLTNQLIQYASEHPGHISSQDIYSLVPAKRYDPLQLADSILNKQKNAEQYSSNKAYSLLKQQLTTYFAISKNGGWQPIQNAANLRKGSKSPAVVAIKKRLQLTKEYAGADTTNIFSDSLVSAIKIYQQHNGFKPTGQINDSLIASMNIPVEQRIEQILINMNRAMWMPPSADSNRLQVNIPSYMLYAYERSNKVFEMPVIVGKEGNSTVMFSGDINEIVFDPTWNVPESIVRNEIVPAMKKDPNYLKKHHMEKTGGSDSLPTIKQLPGKDNSLGRVKFLFPNSHDIYLHDTPDKNLFAKNDRAFSHGCIRVADAQKLAEYLLRNQSDWNSQKIKSAMNAGKEESVKLKQEEPVSITYYTAWVDETGMMNFRNDVYGHDAEASTRMFL
jgi:murein L,D-transpeptidase YcbB/YkuD